MPQIAGALRRKLAFLTMAYQVLARKSRPQDFASLIGQEAIVKALRNALTESRIASAYLFSGIRGVGKTSAARVLAKALNCERGPTADPCNQCTVCLEITRGGDLDVIEVDAATYSKVEQVRELTESLRYGPARDRHKVVILDEVHRLSRQAFDALLKIVEEPPPHLVFIFATTEIEAVPATILSRCQEFRFRRVNSVVLARHLRSIAEQEGIAVGDAALRLIARAGEGSVRDSVALLDQLATFGAGTIGDAEAARLLGGFDSGLLRGVLAAVLSGDGAAVVAAVRQLESEGRDPRHLFAHFLAYCREALHLALGGDPEHLELPEEERADLVSLLAGTRYEDLLRVVHLLLASEAALRRSESGMLALEIAWLRAAELPRLTRIEEVLAGRRDAEPAAALGERPSRAPAGAEARTRAAAPVAEPQSRPDAQGRPGPPGPPAAAPAEPPAEPAGPAEGPTSRATGTQTVETFLEAVGRRKQPVLVRLRQALGLEFSDGVLTITGDADLGRALERESNRKVLDAALADTWDRAVWRFRATGTPERRDEDEKESQQRTQAEQDPRVQQVLDIFGGTVEKVVDR